MKKFIPLVVVGMLVLCGLQAVAMPFNLADSDDLTWKETASKPLSRADELDQSQELMNWIGPVGSGPLWSFANYILVQSFIPTKNLLTRVELLVGKNSTTTYDYTVAIRDNLNGSDLTTVSIPASEITTENYSWMEFDFPNIMVTPGNTYYIVSSTANITDNWYSWGFYMDNVYLNGMPYYSVNDGATWGEEPSGDLAFRTYGTQATTLDVEITGGIGVVVNTKNIGAIDALWSKTMVTVTGGILGLINLSGGILNETLAPNATYPYHIQPLGLGPITFVMTVSADNTVPVTKTVEGFILLFFVILKA
jgi:hypothetical protein